MQRFLIPVWKVLAAWRAQEPLEVRRPIPAVVLAAFISVALAWNMDRLGALLWLAFHGLLRPGEAFSIQRFHLVFVRDLDLQHGSPDTAVVCIANPKTRNRGARRQHVLLGDSGLVRLLRHTFGGLRPHEKLWPYSDAVARARFNVIGDRLGLPRGRYTWASCRSGGASYEYISGASLPALKFRGLWLQERSMEHYIQECLFYLDVSAMPEAALTKIRAWPIYCLASFLRSLRRHKLTLLRARPYIVCPFLSPLL